MNDPKFSWVARKAGVNVATVVAVWAALLEHASQAEPRGSVETFDCEAYDCAFGLDFGTCQSVTEAMREKGLIAEGLLARWSERQPKREDDSAERVRKHREAKRNADVTHGNAPEESREDKKKEEEGAKAPFDPSSVPGLDAAAWAEWVAHRRSIRKPIKNPEKAAKEMAAMGSAQRAAVDRSIASGYQGLFAPTGKPAPKAATGNGLPKVYGETL